MIVDNENKVLRYPGLIPDASQPDGFSRNIAVVGSYSPGAGPFSGSEENITTVPVVQEILPAGADPTDPNTSPFSLVSSVQPPSGRGVVALRINYPFQAATMSATAPNADPSLPNFNLIDTSDDPSTIPQEVDMGVSGKHVYSGQYGLGNQLAFGKIVRPFRRLISAQAIYRREVFGP
jgi:hypothetical protein